MQLINYKKVFINVLVASLIGAASIAVIAVLAGGFSDVLGNTLFTLALVAIHALAALGYIDSTAKQPTAESLKFFANAVFILIVLSFFTSIFGVWELFSGEVVGKLYLTYGILLFATLHGEMLEKTSGKESRIDKIVFANYIFMSAVILMILPLIWLSDFEFGDFYFRLLAALAIIDATLTILAVVFHKLYVQKNPKSSSAVFLPVYDAEGKIVQIKGQQQPSRRLHPLVWILIIFLAAQFIIPVLFIVFGGLFYW